MTQRTNQAETALISPREAAAIAGVTTRTLARMAARGELSTAKPTGSTHRRYMRSQIVALTVVSETSPHVSETPTQGDAA